MNPMFSFQAKRFLALASGPIAGSYLDVFVRGAAARP